MQESTASSEAREVKLPLPGTSWSFPDFIRANVNLDAKNRDEVRWLWQACLANGFPKAKLANIYTLVHRLRKKREKARMPKPGDAEIDELLQLLKQVYEKLPNLISLIKNEKRAYQKRMDDLENILEIALKKFRD